MATPTFLILRPHKASLRDLLRYAVGADLRSFSSFVHTNNSHPHGCEDDENDDQYHSSAPTLVGLSHTPDKRWIVVLSVLLCKIIALFSKPLQWTGSFIEFLLNLLSHNGNLFGLLRNLFRGNVVVPQKGTETFMSIVGEMEPRVDLYNNRRERDRELKPQLGDRALMDLCIMASKLAYENAQFIKNVVNHHWKMHFVDFYNCWNDFQKEMSTQVFILCDKAKDANLILVSFRGTEPFNAADWCTDFDYSWYEIPKVGKVHIGFLEALGLGNRLVPTSFHYHLGWRNTWFKSSNIVNNGAYSSRSMVSDETLSKGSSSDKDKRECDESSNSKSPAYHIVRNKLIMLLNEHKNAKFIVTGHSQGGALAIMFPTVLALHEENKIMERLLGVYTFGQPRIGNMQLGKFMESRLQRPIPRYFRVVYCNDLIPKLPYDNKIFLYKHFGVCLYYNSLYIEKRMEEEPNTNCYGMRFALKAHVNAMWELIRGLTMGYVEGPEYSEGWFRILLRIGGLAFPGISAHCPTDYINSIRLGKDCSIEMSSI